ncbi:MAG TPA: molybdopterin cofactor-binding domain-containing protein, partial [Ktedonobacteraceae bacterium]|nr:molybdopterin cofactor-binding domain-containing protein [Ktedonobacteraceae bacterium]
MELELRINGVIKSVEVAPSESLTNVLRREGYLSVRQGCETSECGACMVLVDGVPRPSCVMLAAQAGGCTVTTVEDLESAHQLNPLQDAFIEVGAIQCGFCTPGMLLSAQALLKRNPSPDEAEVREALSSNLCRCTGYARPVQAILRAAATLRGEKLPPVSPPLLMEQEPWQPRFVPSDLGSINRGPAEARSRNSKSGELASKSEKAETKPMHVGLPERRVDAAKFATGRPSFTDDFERSGYLYARLLTSPHAHALIREINVSEAQDLPGVHAVLTYKDVPRVPHTTAGEPWPDNSPHDRFCLDYAMRYLGDRVAVVAAESPEIAEEALKLIEVNYELQPAIFDPRQALDARAPKIHSEPDSQKIYEASRNLAAHTNFEAGSIERGFKEAEQVIEADYLLPAIQQAPLERHSVMTYWDENRRLVVYTSTDAPFHIRRLLAEVTGLPPQRIKVVRSSVGGSFGSRQDLLFEDLCAQLTIKTNRPVKMVATRAEDLRDGGQRHSQLIHLKTGVKRDGRIVAQQALVLSSTGAYAAHAATDQMNTAANLMALYPSTNQRITAETAYTNLPPAGAFRGFGVAQGLFALESHMNEIAQQLKLDPLELRRRNWVRPGSENLLARELGAAKSRPLASSALPECLRLVEEKLGKQQADSTPGRFRKGKGFALAMYDEQMLPVGVSGASLSLSEDGSFQLLVGMADSVAGTDTLFAQVVAEALGVETSAVTVLS